MVQRCSGETCYLMSLKSHIGRTHISKRESLVLQPRQHEVRPGAVRANQHADHTTAFAVSSQSKTTDWCEASVANSAVKSQLHAERASVPVCGTGTQAVDACHI